MEQGEHDIVRTASRCDVMMLLEGTFPFVSGGVSSWINQIIRGFPELSFGICFMGSRRSDYGPAKYALPDNVVHLECHYLMERPRAPAIRSMHGDEQVFNTVRALHEAMRSERNGPYSAQTIAKLKQTIPLLRGGCPLDEAHFLHSEQAWEYIAEQYEEACTDPSFVDYFWTVRLMHLPIWTLARIASALIPARCYHTISTGYAGFLGALLKQQTGRPLVLSEHGIYTKERKIDLFQSTWIRDNRSVFEKNPAQVPYFRNLWIRFFESLGKVSYDAADMIIALYEQNRQRQIMDGAPAERTVNIANGVDLPKFAALRTVRPAVPPPVLCLIGRVVPIKDVKTFIRAMHSVVHLMPGAEGWIAGPMDEDPDYASECRSIVATLGLQDKVKFLGYQNVLDLMPKIGLVVLSSISEALPLVVIEGFAAGVPAVLTDVGSCRQLIHGLDAEDRALGTSGEIVGIAQPEALAHAAVGLLSDAERWHAAQASGIARVERYYTRETMLAKYRAIYREAIAFGTRDEELGAESQARKGA